MFSRCLYALLVIAAVAAPAASAAEGSALKTYGGPGAVAQGRIESGTTGVLPFTGIDIAVFTVAGLLVVAVGITMRRLGRDRA